MPDAKIPDAKVPDEAATLHCAEALYGPAAWTRKQKGRCKVRGRGDRITRSPELQLCGVNTPHQEVLDLLLLAGTWLRAN